MRLFTLQWNAKVLLHWLYENDIFHILIFEMFIHNKIFFCLFYGYQWGILKRKKGVNFPLFTGYIKKIGLEARIQAVCSPFPSADVFIIYFSKHICQSVFLLKFIMNQNLKLTYQKVLYRGCSYMYIMYKKIVNKLDAAWHKLATFNYHYISITI